MKVLLRKIGDDDNNENDEDEQVSDKLDLIEKYRICLQSLIIAKYDTKDHKTNNKWSTIIKYLYNANNITIQSIQTDIH